MTERILLIIILLFFGFFIWLEINIDDPNPKVDLGKHIIVNNDTLQIIDYNYLHGEFISYGLSNGSNIDKDLINKMTILNYKP